VWTGEGARAVLEDGASLVALGRSIIVDPDWPEMVRAGLTPRRAFPRLNWEALDVPPPLARKILETPGWFPVEDEP